MRRFARFWWDFLIGDDWRVAAGIVATLGATAALSSVSLPAWWLVPLGVAVLLWLSLRRAVRRARLPSP